MKPPLDSRVLDPARVLRPSPLYLEQLHVEVVQDIAEQLFAFPTPEFPHFRTFVNEPEVTQRIFTNYGRDLAPDIVVLEWPERIVRIVAEVATINLLTPDEAKDHWLPESRLEGVAFYLYVPAGYLEQAKVLLKEAGIRKKDVGLRTWRRVVGLRSLDIATYT
jgi:hypothetical protein